MTNAIPIREQIVGTWELVEYSMTSADGEVHHPLGPDARGLIIYTPDGFMSAQLMTPGRPQFHSPNVHGGEPDELIIAARGYLAYTGPFHVDEETRTVHHVTTVSLFPNWVGTDRLRIVRFDGDDAMTLSTAPFEFRGTSWKGAVVWRRAA
ncbi:lipocalin-like domain-containing protein [Mycobacterium sp. MUNTM1]